MQALREELVSPGIAPVSVPMLLEVDELEPMNGPFSMLEFSAALETCNFRSAPGLDGIGYGVLRGMSERAEEFILSLFNQMFIESRFPHSWRDTLVTFLPKTGSTKFRLISLTSTLCSLRFCRVSFSTSSLSWRFGGESSTLSTSSPPGGC